MRQFTLTVFLCLIISISYAAPRYWVGNQDGNWNDAANWSELLNGAGGASVPGAQDSVIFYHPGTKLIRLDGSTTVRSIYVNGNVTLYTSVPVNLRILSSLSIFYQITLKDSTSADVPFNVILNGATNAIASIYGQWMFEGGVAITNRLTSGASFIAETGSRVTVTSVDIRDSRNPSGAKIVCKNFSGTINSDKSSLVFTYNTSFILDNNLDAKIPLATWYEDRLTQYTYSGTLDAPGATLVLKTDIQKLEFPEAEPDFCRIVIDLPNLSADFDLGLPNKTLIRGNLEIYNTNNRRLTLLAGNSASNSTDVTLGRLIQRATFGGNLIIDGNSTNVSLARASSNQPAASFRMHVFQSFNQTGGIFSLQDFNGATGNTTLEINNDFIQTAGVFTANSTSESGKFRLTMGTPLFITGPSGSYQGARVIRANSGSIDNATHNVTLRIEHKFQLSQFSITNPEGIFLNTPLSVGRLELAGAPITSTAENLLTVNNPSRDAVVVGDASNCCLVFPNVDTAAINYVNGPLRRATNSTAPYLFPVGKGNNLIFFPSQFSNTLHSDSCYIIPASGTPSVYQVEYFHSAYPDANITSPLNGISTAEYWNIFKVSGGDASVRLFPNGEAVPGAVATNALVAANYVGGHWIAQNGTTLLPGNTISGSVTSKPLSTPGLFTFGYGDPDKLAPANGSMFNGLRYKYYEGGYSVMPNFNNLTPSRTGESDNFDINIHRTGVTDSFAIVWEGYINIPVAGTYTFETNSDDGSKLYFNSLYNPNGIALIDNDSTHPPKTVAGTINIAAPGRYPFTVTYFENYGAEGLQVHWSGPGIPRQLIPASAFVDGSTPAPSSGLTYKYYEGGYNMMPDFNTLTPVKKGNSDNFDLGVHRAGVTDSFAIVWDGYINIPAAGSYTFETVSDDGSKLYFNSLYNAGTVPLVNNDGTHPPQSVTGTVYIPAAGKYPITVTYFENYGGEGLQVYWSGPGFPRQQIPASAFTDGNTPPATTSGLNYRYYEGSFNLLPDFNTLVPVRTGSSANININVRPSGVNDNFAFVWEGFITLPASGTHTFRAISDDGSRLIINGTTVINNDGTHAPQTIQGTIDLPAGTYPVSISYFELGGGEVMELYWLSGGTFQLVPDAAFITAAIESPVQASGLSYKYYEGDFNVLPDFDGLVPVKTGTSANADISVRPQGINDHFAFIWKGMISLPAAGTYVFETISDDGSKVYLNSSYSPSGNGLVNNDGLHAAGSSTGTITVSSAGRYPITITYFEKDGGETMELYWTGPGIARQIVPDAAFTGDGLTGLLRNDVGTLNSIIDASFATRVYPNPFRQSFTIDYFHQGSTSGKVSIGVYDVNGKLIYSYQPAGLSVGLNRWTVAAGTKRFMPGIYMVQVKVNGVVVEMVKLVRGK